MVWVGAAFALGGLYLLSITGGFGFGLGDGLVLAGAFWWAVHVHIIGWLAGRVRSLLVAAVQFVVCGVLSLIVALCAETISVAGLLRAGIPILYSGLLSTGVAYTLQIFGQRRVDPARSGIILSLEGAFWGRACLSFSCSRVSASRGAIGIPNGTRKFCPFIDDGPSSVEEEDHSPRRRHPS